jgi:hypothetical protein
MGGNFLCQRRQKSKCASAAGIYFWHFCLLYKNYSQTSIKIGRKFRVVEPLAKTVIIENFSRSQFFEFVFFAGLITSLIVYFFSHFIINISSPELYDLIFKSATFFNWKLLSCGGKSYSRIEWNSLSRISKNSLLQ